MPAANSPGMKIGTVRQQGEPLEGKLRNMLELKNITKSFGDTHVLNGISLTLDKGQIMSILGPSGGGKTTLLNIILGITDPTSGQIIYDGEDLTQVPMEKRGFNIVFQDYALFPNLTAYQNITYGLRNNPGISSEAEIKELISLLGLEEHLNKRIDELSGGQKQRVALARTLVMKPKLLLLDEPLSALDGVIKESIKAKIKQIVEQYKLTTIMVTHDPEEACTMSDKVLIINHGKIAQYDTPENIIEHPASDFVKKFILHQLEVKRNNIYTLFNEGDAKAAEANRELAAQEA
ncbi:ABC transporter [Bifidobacterium hapali]|uniref:ABC-type quaternary amine transporter n=2 Tax=Bifidobacterium hapali TaxID=1630172 RepID=A0A261FVM4_9BIFI|nr:ABC transporter [Bifidobacterium hapali]